MRDTEMLREAKLSKGTPLPNAEHPWGHLGWCCPSGVSARGRMHTVTGKPCCEPCSHYLALWLFWKPLASSCNLLDLKGSGENTDLPQPLPRVTYLLWSLS